MQKQNYCSYVSSQKLSQHYRYHLQKHLAQEKMSNQIKPNLSYNTEKGADQTDVIRNNIQ